MICANRDGKRKREIRRGEREKKIYIYRGKKTEEEEKKRKEKKRREKKKGTQKEMCAKAREDQWIVFDCFYFYFYFLFLLLLRFV